MKAQIPKTTDGISTRLDRVTLYTGKLGMEEFEHLLQKRNAVDMLQWMVDEKKITSEKRDNLVAMLNSDDWENFNLAMNIIRIKNGLSI